MKAARLVSTDTGQVVRIEDVSEPGSECELMIEVHAAGVGFPDLLMSRGEFQIRQELPFTLGWEASGVVAAASQGSGFEVGERVVSMALGAYAERVPALSSLTFTLPEELSFEEGAAYPHNYLTAYAGLIRRGGLARGERVLVHGAGGGVGSAAIQVAKAANAETFAVVSSDEKAAIARAAGADHILHPDGAWREEAIELSDGGVNLIFDPVGGDRLLDSLRALAPEGRLVVIGFAAGEIPQAPLNRLLMKNIDIRGCSWGVLAAGPDGIADAGRTLNAWVSDGLVRPLVGSTYPLAQLPTALDQIVERAAVGKTVVAIQ